MYRDDDVDTLLDAMYSALVVAPESHQHQQAVRVLETYRTMLARASGPHRRRILDDLVVMRPLVDQLLASPGVERAWRPLTAASAEESRLVELSVQ